MKIQDVANEQYMYMFPTMNPSSDDNYNDLEMDMHYTLMGYDDRDFFKAAPVVRDDQERKRIDLSWASVASKTRKQMGNEHYSLKSPQRTVVSTDATRTMVLQLTYLNRRFMIDTLVAVKSYYTLCSFIFNVYKSYYHCLRIIGFLITISDNCYSYTCVSLKTRVKSRLLDKGVVNVLDSRVKESLRTNDNDVDKDKDEVDFTRMLRRLILPHDQFPTQKVRVIVNPAFVPMRNVIEDMSRGKRVPPEVSMIYEMLRLCSFRSYPAVGKPFAIRFAQAGFYYALNGDEVVCYCCRKRVSSWKMGENPLEVHRRVSPNCPFLVNNAEVNVPAGPFAMENHTNSLESMEQDKGPSSNEETSLTPTTNAYRPAEQLTGTDVETTVASNNYSMPTRSTTNTDLVENQSFASSVGGGFESMPAQPSQTNINNRGNDQHQTNRPSSSSVYRPAGQFVMTKPRATNSDNTMTETLVSKTPAGGFRSMPTSTQLTCANTTQRNKSLQMAAQNQTISNNQSVVENSAAASTQSQSNATEKPLEQRKHPKYPAYVDYEIRLATFDTCTSIAASKESVCEAGFFYAGVADCTKCFQCGLGLRHWSVDDDPWVEHARFSLDCSYVRKKKGEEFIHLIKLAIDYTKKNGQPSPNTGSTPNATGGSSEASNSNLSSGTGQRSVTMADLLKSNAAQTVMKEGFTEDVVKTALGEIVKTSAYTPQNPPVITVASIQQAINTLEKGGRGHHVGGKQTATNSRNEGKQMTSQSAHNRDTTVNNASKAASNQEMTGHLSLLPLNLNDTENEGACGSNQDMHRPRSEPLSLPPQLNKHRRQTDNKPEVRAQRKKMKDENANLKAMSLCSHCKKDPVSIVFLPCGHLVTCELCAPRVKKCFMAGCDQVIKGTVRTFRA